MPKKVVAANLLDMVELVTSRQLQEEVFTLNAPDMKITWDRLPRNSRRRAKLLSDQMEKMANARSKTLRDQHANLFRTLNTIALINADSANTAEIDNKIAYKPALKTFLNDSFAKYDLPEGTRKTANLVAFVNVVMMKEKDTNAGIEAKAVWDDLLASAMAELDAIKHDQFKLLPPQRGFNRTIGLSEFEEELRLTVEDCFHEREYLVVAVCNTVDNYKRYLVKTTPLAHDVSKVVKGKNGKRTFENRPDDNADAFEIRYYEHHNRITISRTRIVGTRKIAAMFARKVLGTRLDESKKRFYDEPLQIFRTRKCLETIKLPKESLENKDVLWIQSIKLSPTEVRKNDDSGNPLNKPIFIERTVVTYTGDEHHFVFDEMDALLDPVRFPRAHQNILSAEVAMRLHKTKEVDGKRLPCDDEKTYVIRITERHFTVVDRNKIHDKYLLDFFDKIQSDWGFEGLTPDEHKLSKRQPTVKGEADDLFGNS